MQYVFPYCAKIEKQLNQILCLNRLCAFPSIPNFKNYNFVIIDSGAYALSIQKKKMNKSYMERLNQHYEKYYQANFFCIAPDEFLNPTQSMWNFKIWQQNNFFKNITAVLQAEKKRQLNIDNLFRQVDYYRKYTDSIFFSNNGLTGEMARKFHIERLFKYMKSLKIKHIHCLGAGWNIEDIKQWSATGVDSIDSIAYYTTNDANEFGSVKPLENVYTILELTKTL